MSAIAVVTALMGVLGLLAGLADRSGRTPHRMSRVWARIVLRCLGVRTRVLGLEQLPRGPALYAVNHASALDIPLVFATLPVDFRIIHKRSLNWLPLLGWYLYLAGHIGIDRSNPFRARRSLARRRAGSPRA